MLRTGPEVKCNINGCGYIPQHLTSEQLMVNDYSKDYWNSYYKFSFVRNPYDRMVSEYYFSVLSETNSKFKNSEFTVWLNNVVSKQDWCHNIPQSRYLIKNGDILVNDVFKFETLSLDINRLKKILSIQDDLPHKKNSRRGTYSLNDENKEIIYELFYDDFKNFNYKK